MSVMGIEEDPYPLRTIAFIGDRHLWARMPQYADACTAWAWAIDDAHQAGVDLFVNLGDVCQGWPASGAELDRLVGFYQAEGRTGTLPIEVLGNHEAPDALDWLPTAKIARVVAHQLMGYGFANVFLGLIPYPRRGAPPFDALGAQDIRGSLLAAAARIGEAITTWRDVARSRPLIIAGHFTVGGMRVGNSDFELHTGTEVVVSPALLADADLVLTGHIHKPQEIEHVVNVGSTWRCTRAERTDTKSYVLAHVTYPTVTWERREIPTRPMLDFSLSWAEVVAGRLPHDVSGAEVFATVLVQESDLPAYEETRLATLLETRGAARWTIERETPRHERVRAPEITTPSERSLYRELELWATATGRSLDGREDAIRTKLEQVTV